MVDVFVKGNISSLQLRDTFNPFGSAPLSQQELQVLFMSMVIPLDKEVPIPDLANVVALLFATARHSSATSLTGAQCIASIINKQPEGSLAYYTSSYA
jgi:hypothetical protein